MNIEIKKANAADLDNIAFLFDAYRVFYSQKSDIELAKRFIGNRLTQQDSVIFIASVDSQVVGFTQLYPSFSSVSAQRTWILNDLYVSESMRHCGVAKKLMEAAREHALTTQAKGISLATAIDNHVAKHLYDVLGYKKNDAFDYYFLAL